MKIPYFCCIGAELKRYQKDFDFMNQVYLYKIPTDDTLEEVLTQDYFQAIADTVLQDDLLYIYEPTAQVLHTCRFNKQGGHITAVQLTNNVPELTPNRVLISDAAGHITAGDVTLEYLKNKVNLDGTSIMTGPLKMRSSVSFKCAIAPSWDGVGFYKLNDDDSVTLMASMESTEGLTPAADNTYNIGKSNRRWKDLYIARVITGVLNNGANIEIPTKAGTMALESDIGRTNCITEIPQDLKIEISSGTFTLKAGSKVYVPNGAGNFDTITTASDLSVTPSMFATSSNRMVVYSPGGTISMLDIYLPYVYSGATAPTVFDGNGRAFWYDTANNSIKKTTDSGSTWQSGYGFPIALVHITNGIGIDKIEHAFNGFGYIGTTVFVLPGVKGIAANGRNADGTLKNTAIENTAVKLFNDLTSNTGYTIAINNSAGLSYFLYREYSQETYPGNSYRAWYRPSENILYNTRTSENDLQNVIATTICYFNATTGEFAPKYAFHAVDYNDTEFIAHQATPSNRYIDLTLPTSGNVLIAPADGYFAVGKNSTASGQRLRMWYRGTNSGDLMSASTWSSGAENLELSLYVAKGSAVAFVYTADGTTNYCRFIYANGAK